MATFTCTHKATGEAVNVSLQLIGEHNVYNALSAIAGAFCYGVPMAVSAQALATARLTGSRQEIVISAILPLSMTHIMQVLLLWKRH